MNQAHWHLVVNHLPIIFPLVGFIVMVIGMITKSAPIKRTALMIFILGAFASIAAMSTGEGAEEVIEQLNQTNENYIKTHEEIAELLALLSYILGAVSLIGLWASLRQKAFAGPISVIALLLSCVVLFFAQQTGTTGGGITHTEIRSGNNVATIENRAIEKHKDD